MASRESRLQSFAATALINFADAADMKDLQPFMEGLMNVLLSLVEGGVKGVQTAAVGALAHLVEVAESGASVVSDLLSVIIYLNTY